MSGSIVETKNPSESNNVLPQSLLNNMYLSTSLDDKQMHIKYFFDSRTILINLTWEKASNSILGHEKNLHSYRNPSTIHWESPIALCQNVDIYKFCQNLAHNCDYYLIPLLR